MIASAGYDLVMRIHDSSSATVEVCAYRRRNARASLQAASNHFTGSAFDPVSACSHGCPRYSAGCQNDSRRAPNNSIPIGAP
jgi:hypothetical protein